MANFDADEARGEVVEKGIFKGHTPHRRFSQLDVVRIALIERLTEFGFETEEASEAVENVFREVCAQQKLRYFPPRRRENAKLIEALRGTTLFFDMGKRLPVLQGKGKIRMERMRDHMIFYENEWQKAFPAAQGARLILFAGGIVNEIFERLDKTIGAEGD